MSIKQKILKILVAKDWSQEELAIKINVAPSQISRWLNEDFCPRKKNIAKIDNIFNSLTA